MRIKWDEANMRHRCLAQDVMGAGVFVWFELTDGWLYGYDRDDEEHNAVLVRTDGTVFYKNYGFSNAWMAGDEEMLECGLADRLIGAL